MARFIPRPSLEKGMPNDFCPNRKQTFATVFGLPRGRLKTPFEEVVAAWRAERNTDSKNLKIATLAREKSDVRNHLLPRFGRVPVADIQWEDIEAMRNEKLKLLAPATVTRILAVLSQILDRAVKHRYIAVNPCKFVHKPGTKKKRKDLFLTADELNALADAMPPRFRALVLLAGYRGMRFGELAGLKKAHLNLLARRLEVSEQLSDVNGQRFFDSPKSDQGIRSFTLPRFLAETLQEHIAKFSPTGEMVFTSDEGTMLRDSNFNRRVWRPATASLPDEKHALKFHELRHTAVSLLVPEGASLIEVGAILGWSANSIPAMSARYGHLYESRDQKLADATDATYRAAVKLEQAAPSAQMKSWKFHPNGEIASDQDL